MMEEIRVSQVMQTVAPTVVAEVVEVCTPVHETVSVLPAPEETISVLPTTREEIAVAIEEISVFVNVPAVIASGPPPANQAPPAWTEGQAYLAYQFGGTTQDFTVVLDCSKALAFWLDLRGVSQWCVVTLALLNVPSAAFSEVYLLLNMPTDYSLAIKFPGSLPTYWPTKGVANEYIIRSWDGGLHLAMVKAGYYAI